jgi:hypothetical protein
VPDSSLTDLDPDFLPIAELIMSEANATISPSKTRIIITWRSPQDQQAAKANGASKAGPGQSPHNNCMPDGAPAARAFDFAVFDEDGAYVQDGRDSRYASIGLIAVKHGQIWGGNWTPETDGCMPDFDHIEMYNWRFE